MSICHHCQGRGVSAIEPQRRAPASRGAASGKLPPFGREVEEAVRDGTAPASGVNLFCRPCPITGKDAWGLAAQHREQCGPGSAMVLPDGEDPSTYRWPAIPVQFETDPVVVVWAYGFTREEERTIGTALVTAGYDVVDVLGGPGGPLRFKLA